MPTRRGYLAAVTGSDGTIYAIGGFDPVLGSQTGAMEAYDPTTDAWTTLAPMPKPRYALGAAIGSDGTIRNRGLLRPTDKRGRGLQPRNRLVDDGRTDADGTTGPGGGDRI